MNCMFSIRRFSVCLLAVFLVLVFDSQSSSAIDTRSFEIPPSWDAEQKEEFWGLLSKFEDGFSTTKEQCEAILELSGRHYENCAFDFFRELLRTSPEELIRRTAIEALSRSRYVGGEVALPELLNALRKGNPAIQLRAAYLIESLLDRTLLSKDTYSDEQLKQFQAIYAELTNDSDVVVSNLFRFIWPTYEPPYEGFEEAEPDLRHVIPVLIAALKIERENPIPFEENAKVESTLGVLYAFGELGPAGEFTIPIMINELKSITEMPTGFLNHGDLAATHVNTAIGALAKIGDASLPQLRQMLESENELHRKLAAIAIPPIDPTAKEVIPVLLNSLQGHCWRIHTYATDYRRDANSLALMGNIAVVPYIEAIKKHDDLKKFNYQILKGISGEHDYTKLVLPYLEAPNPSVRYVAVWGLAYQGPKAKASLSQLKQMLQKEETEEVKDAIEYAIKQLQKEAGE